MEHHAPLEFTPGDDWQIDGSLLDPAGAALDLTGATIEWVLLDPTGVRVLDQDSSFVTVEAPDPMTDGKVIITVERGGTIERTPGRYADAVRVTVPGGGTSTLWEGQILVDENLFYEEDVA